MSLPGLSCGSLSLADLSRPARSAARTDPQPVALAAAEAVAATGPALPDFALNVGHLTFDLCQSFNPLSPSCVLDYRVEPGRDGLVVVSVTMPQAFLRGYVVLLQSLTGFFRAVDVRASAERARVRAAEPERAAEAHRQREAFSVMACACFDAAIAEGLPQNEAIKAANARLKARKHPWATYAVVLQTLREAGRLKSARRKPRASPSTTTGPAGAKGDSHSPRPVLDGGGVAE